MRPGDTVKFVVGRSTAAGAASTGKTITDFTIGAYKNGSTASVSPAITERSTTGAYREYELDVTLPTGGPYWFHMRVVPASGTDIIAPDTFTEWIGTQDIDSTYASVIRPVGSLSTSSTFASDVQLEMIAYRYNPIAVHIVTQDGTDVDLSGYNNWRFSVWDKTHSGSILYTNALDIAGNSAGALTFHVPENAAFYSAIAAAFTANSDFATLYYDVIGDAAADATKTTTVLRGKLILWRFEGAA